MSEKMLQDQKKSKRLQKFAYAILCLSTLNLVSVRAQMKDAEGNQYPTKVIGALEWTTENLKSTRFRNGEAIPVVRSRAEWTKSKAAARIAPDSTESRVALLGYLYNWHTVNDPRGLCPAGWRVPTHNEWTAITQFLGGEKTAGTTLKMSTGWTPGFPGNNASGFNGRPAGFRAADGSFGGIGSYGYWWSATASNINGAWGRFVDYNQEGIFMMDGYKKSAFSVRCVRKPVKK
jgi:uncharacterized protein (TIGR02145 family)